MPEISFAIAFSAGILTFFSACLIPIVPAYISYISGISIEELSEAKNKSKKEFFRYRRRIVINSVFFILGFSAVFVLLGLAATSLGQFLNEKKLYLERVGGVFMIFLGIYMAEFVKMPSLYKELKFKIKKSARPLFFNSFLLGVAFGFSWTPCISPILSGILFLASLTQTIWQGGLLLAVFALGLAIPFFVLSLMLTAGLGWVSKFSKLSSIVKYIASVILIFIGTLMLVGRWEEIVAKFFH